MNVSIRAAVAAIGCLCVSVPALAASDRMVVTARVPVAGLDLGSKAGSAILDARLNGAIRTACTPAGAGTAAYFDSRRCMREMKADAATRVAQLVRGTQIASR